MDFLKRRFVLLFFLGLPIIFFRPYFFEGKVPFPSNLLVSFYEPWRSYSSRDFPSGPPNKPLGFDNLRIFYPLRSFTTNQLKNFNIPLWNPYYFSGNTHLANYQSAVFHPLSFLFLILPQIDAWSIIIIISPFLASIFTYLFLREIDLDKKSSVFGSLVFAFSGFMIVWWEESFMAAYSALFLPLVLYAIISLSKKITTWKFIILILGLSSSVLSGWFQMSLYVYIFSILFVAYLFLKKKLNPNKLKVIALGFLASLFISASHLIPSTEAYLYSARGTTDAKFLFDTYLLSPNSLITLFVSDFFGNPGSYNYFGLGSYYEKVCFVGIIGLIFGLYGLLITKAKNPINFFKISFLLSISLGFSLPTSWIILYNLKIPFLSSVIPSRIFFISTFALSVLSAYGIREFLLRKNRSKIYIPLLVIGVGLFIGWIFGIQEKGFSKEIGSYSLIIKRNLILPTFTFISFCFFIVVSFIIPKLNKLRYFAILFFFLLGSFYFASKYLYFSEKRFVFPSNPVLTKLKQVTGNNRAWTVEKGYVERNFMSQYQIQSPEGYDSFFISRYGELLFAAQNGGKYTQQIPRADVTIPSVDEISEILDDPYRVKLLDLLSVSYIAGKKVEASSRPELERIWRDDVYSIYKYSNSLPRAFLLGDYIQGKANQEILSYIFSGKTNLATTVVLEQTIPNFKKIKDFKGTAKINYYNPQEIEIITSADSNSLLFLSDNYYPGWKAYVDKIPSRIYRANYSFRSVLLPSGRHSVIFKYEPDSFRIGVLASVIGLILASIGVIVIKFNKYETKP